MSETIWSPRVDRAARPVYKAIADALEHDLAHGVLREGERLPTHRHLARTLSVTPLTITRAYKEAARRGLIESTVGRGTFVRATIPPLDPAHAERGLLDLSKNVVAGSDLLDVDARAATALRPLIREADYDPTAGALRYRMAGAAWMKRNGLEVAPESVVMTPGAQQAIVAILAAICRPGDTVITEEVTYPRFASIAGLLRLKMEPIEVDDHGLVPRALEKAASKGKALYCVPNFQNPTGGLMPEKRRREIAAIARRHNIFIIEDDVYGFLLDSMPRTIASFAPDRVCFITSASKSLTPSLRLGFAAIPDSLLDHVTAACGAMTAFTASPSGEIFTMLADNGSGERCMASKREVVARNRAAADRALWSLDVRAHPMSPHLWIKLPKTCDAHELAERARQRGIGVAPASSFSTSRGPAPNAVRVSIGSTTDTRALESALRTLATLIADPRMGSGAVV